MGKKEFKTLEEALEHIGTLETVVAENDVKIKKLEQEVKDAQAIATDAVEKANKDAAKVPGEITGKVGKDTYIILFGVDGLTKEALAENESKLKELIKKGSGAIVKKEA